MSGLLIDDIAARVNAKSIAYNPDAEVWKDWGDPSGNARTGIDGNSYISKLSEHGIYVDCQYLGVSEGIQALKQALRPSKHTDEPGLVFVRGAAKKTISAFENAQWDRAQGNNEHSREKYRHDIHSHPLDACRYFVSAVAPILDCEFSFF